MNTSNISINEFSRKVSPEQLCQLLSLIEKGSISSTIAKQVFEEMFNTGKDASDIIAQRGLSQISDTGELEEVASQVIQVNAQAVADFRAGKAPALKFLVGQVMKATKGRANPQVVNDNIPQSCLAV
jgi:aspartyl-tRNA(Asn)/glutamyl-tRNA(Gln) amidotransferase subunit B